jgi:tellurite methyltransferase
MANRTVDYFEEQFRKQIASAGSHDAALNAFQQAALPFLSGRVLDLACGLGALSVAAARNGCEVIAVDASPTAIQHVATVARAEGLNVTPVQHDAATYCFDGPFDAVVAIGILMFFPRDVALGLLEKVQLAVRPGGHAIVTALLEGTTFTDVFDGDRHHLFDPEELRRAFDGWDVRSWRREKFPSPNGTLRRIGSMIARKAPSP